MGTITVSQHGILCVDSNILIYSVEKIAPYYACLEPLWRAAEVGDFRVVSSDLSYLECLVKPYQRHDAVKQELFREFMLDTASFSFVTSSIELYELAARIRAETGLKTADAIHAAAGVTSQADIFLTNDPVFRRVSGLNTIVLSDFLK